MINEIVKRQKELILLLSPREKLPRLPLDLNDKEHQIIIKDFAWRFTEEIVEASYASPLTYKEELIDALHFLIGIFILSGIKPEEPIEFPCQQLARIEYDELFQVMQSMALAISGLKKKKWHKNPTESTNVEQFKDYIQSTLDRFFQCMNRIMPHDEILKEYILKNDKNKARFL